MILLDLLDSTEGWQPKKINDGKVREHQLEKQHTLKLRKDFSILPSFDMNRSSLASMGAPY